MENQFRKMVEQRMKEMNANNDESKEQENV